MVSHIHNGIQNVSITHSITPVMYLQVSRDGRAAWSSALHCLSQSPKLNKLKPNLITLLSLLGRKQLLTCTGPSYLGRFIELVGCLVEGCWELFILIINIIAIIHSVYQTSLICCDKIYTFLFLLILSCNYKKICNLFAL